MIVHVVLQGLFAILGPVNCPQMDPGQVLFLDPTAYNETAPQNSQIPSHDMKIRYEGSKRLTVTDLRLPVAALKGAVEPVDGDKFVGLFNLAPGTKFRADCRGPQVESTCTLNGKKLVKYSISLAGGQIRPCESLGGQIFMDPNPDSELLQEKYFQTGGIVTRSNPIDVFGSALFSYETADSDLILNGETIQLSPSCPGQYPELEKLFPGKSFTVIFLMNDASGHVMTAAGTAHLGVFYDLLDPVPAISSQATLVADQRPQQGNPPRSPSNQCIPVYVNGQGGG